MYFSIDSRRLRLSELYSRQLISIYVWITHAVIGVLQESENELFVQHNDDMECGFKQMLGKWATSAR